LATLLWVFYVRSTGLSDDLSFSAILTSIAVDAFCSF